MAEPVVTTFSNEHVDVISTKSFDETVRDLTAELGSASTEKLMDRLASSATWDDYAVECAELAGRSCRRCGIRWKDGLGAYGPGV